METLEIDEHDRPDLVCLLCGQDAQWIESSSQWIAEGGEAYCLEHPGARLLLRDERPDEIQRMRHEMLHSYAPMTEGPIVNKHRTVRGRLVEDDYGI